MTRLSVLPVVLALALGVTARPAGKGGAAQWPQAQRVGGFDQTQAWLRQARAHAIGETDEAARSVAAYPPQLTLVILNDVQLIRLLVALASHQPLPGSSASNPSADHGGRRLKFDQLAPLLGIDPAGLEAPFTPAELARPGSPARRAVAELMIQVAMLHTDIAMTTGDLAPPASGRPGPRTAATAIQLRDGRELVVANLSAHWAIAREAIAMVLPATAGAGVGRQWYHATSAYLQGDRNYASLLPHLETARAILPADAWVWLQSGAAYENMAAPAVQVAAEAVGGTARVETPSILLGRAEILLRRALAIDSALEEARLRLGRVLDLAGRHEEAAGMLAMVEQRLQDPVLAYYAALFGGRAAEAGLRIAEARSAFERAMALFPRAQSPRLALAELAWRSGDQTLALSGLRTMFVTAGGDRWTDPWWVYDVSLVTDWPAQIVNLRRAAAGMVTR